ncbi:MAG TPA: CheR family methyltransferase [Spongiibacteraceae bacterium]|jgi:two-component system CheB/CheR fusion protein
MHEGGEPAADNADEIADRNIADAPDKELKQTSDRPLMIGVGASAGGFDAFCALLEALPAEPGFALIFVQHQDSGHEGLLTDLLARRSRMPVIEIKDPIHIQANHVYVAPADSKVSMSNGVLTLQRFDPASDRHKTIDTLLIALAQDQADNAVGVLLSGTASDGINGLKEIREMGGITLVQDARSARFNDLPLAAVQAGAADYVLPPAAIALELLRIAGAYPKFFRPRSEPQLKSAEHEILKKILIQVWALSGIDFSSYKQTTVKRRIERRIVLTKLTGFREYYEFLEKNPGEVQALYQDLMINVTHFFRESEVFHSLHTEILPKLLQNKTEGAPIRVWVPGCSSGEEVYSFAITLLEFLGEKASSAQIQIFGTDISDAAIERARAAFYPASIETDVSQQRLQRFFMKRDGGYQIAKPVRDLCVFARQNVFKDPPFSNLDIISCRNVLIYFGIELQRRVFPMFHYALNASGYLILGGSESIGSYATYFSLAHSKQKIYCKKNIAPQLMFEFSRGSAATERHNLLRPLRDDATRSLEPQREADRMILDKYGPPCVLINSDMIIIQFRGKTGLFLEPAAGTASFHLLRMAREGLAVPCHTAVQEAMAAQLPVRKDGIRFRSNGGFSVVDLSVMPLLSSGPEKFLLVTFENARHEDESSSEGTVAEMTMNENKSDPEETLRLQQELSATKEYLQSVIESQEAFNEELRSANEEILSANEELQSTNEELETAKEELQSANEELTTLNEELQIRNQDLANVNDDLSNLLNSINLAIIMLDGQLCVRRFTPLAEKLMNLIPSDVGRPFSDINPSIIAPGLPDIVREVIDTLATREMEVQDRDGRWYNLRIRPYKTMENRIDGALLALVDIGLTKQATERAERSAESLVIYADAMHEPVVMLTAADLRIYHANRAFCNRYQLTLAEIQHRRLNELGDPALNSQSLRYLLQDILPREQCINNFVLDAASGASVRLVVNARQIAPEGVREPMTLLAISERTEMAEN